MNRLLVKLPAARAKRQAALPKPRSGLRRTGLQYFMQHRWAYLLLLPGLIYFLVFKYYPMYGIIIAFKQYQPMIGIMDSPWTGLNHFRALFNDTAFTRLFVNTLTLALLQLLFFFPAPIILALLLHEVRHRAVKSFMQTALYLPHFVSWVVVVSIAYMILTPEDGLLNGALALIGAGKTNLLMSESWFRPLMVLELIWKESGWGTIFFLAALAGIDPGLYEAARMDGASRFRQLWHITLPGLKATIIILLILRLGSVLDTGFEQILLSLNAANREVGEVFDTYVYRLGIQEGRYSYSTAIGLFKSVVGLTLIIAANYGARRAGEEGIY